MYTTIVKLMTTIVFVCFAANAWAAQVNFVKADTFKGWLSEKKPLILADIQKPHEFKKHYFYGSVETDAYPAKTEEEKGKLAVIVRMHEKTGMDVVIIGPRGGASDKRAAMYLIDRGVPAENVFILDGGVNNWPDQEMLLNVAGGCG